MRVQNQNFTVYLEDILSLIFYNAMLTGAKSLSRCHKSFLGSFIKTDGFKVISGGWAGSHKK
jgi:hypothetical protein